MQKSRLSIKQLWGITFLIWTVIALFHYAQFYLEHAAGDNEFLWFATTFEFMVNYYSWIGIAAMVVWLGKKFRPQPAAWALPLFVHVASAITFALLHLSIIATVLETIKPTAFPGYTFGETFVFAALQLFHFECLLYGVVLALSYGFENYAAEKRPEETESSKYLTKLTVKNNGHTRLLQTTQIDWLEAADNYINIHAGKTSFMLREKMHVLETQLDPRNFQRVHRSAIVNVARIKEFIRGDNGNYVIVLDTGHNLPVSRRRREQLQRSISQLR